MKILNLVDLSKSDIKYKISKYPDGQQNVIVGDIGNLLECHHEKGVCIKSRLNNFLDLELIICTTKSLRALGVKEIHLYVPYFIGARSDRQFEEGSNNYLKTVICPIINSLKLDEVIVLDPHSHVLEACLDNFKKESNIKLVDFTFRELTEMVTGAANNFTIISPDAGATHKIYKLVEELGYGGDIITCSKERDTNGKLTKTVVPLGSLYAKPEHLQKDLIIIDDICDGGTTFINIAKVIKEDYKYKGKLYLIVTHGIFSAGYKELGKYFDGIYCTNSYKNVPELEWDGDKRDIPTKVKQLDIF